jgi:hypothetical protein
MRLRCAGGAGACADVAIHVSDRSSGAQVGTPSYPLCGELPGSGVFDVEVFGVGGRTGGYAVRLESAG